MFPRIILFIAVIGVIALGSYFFFLRIGKPGGVSNLPQRVTPPSSLSPLAISAMRQRTYPGSSVTIEQTLPPGSNYKQYIASYKSDNLKIYALLTVPEGKRPKNGWPIIVFNHGYIPPAQYRTTERYTAYVDAFARNGYIVFKPDYRGNGLSEGKPEGAYFSPAYTVDDLNAISSIKKYQGANPAKIGVWGHSMGGNITLRDLVVRPKEIKAAVIWGGVVASYSGMLNWHDPYYHPSRAEIEARRGGGRQDIVKKYGTPKANPEFWNSIDPTHYLSDVQTPVQLDTGGADEEVPPAFSQYLYRELKKHGKTVVYNEYPGADHNISQSLDQALSASIAFFDKYLK